MDCGNVFLILLFLSAALHCVYQFSKKPVLNKGPKVARQRSIATGENIQRSLRSARELRPNFSEGSDSTPKNPWIECSTPDGVLVATELHALQKYT